MTADIAKTVKQVAELLSLSEHATLKLIAKGDLKAIDVSLTRGGRPRWRILPDDLEAFLLRRTRQAPPPRRRRRKPVAVTEYF